MPLPALITYLKSGGQREPLRDDERTALRQEFVAAVRGIGPKAVPVLIPALESPNEWDRQAVAEALGQFGPAARRYFASDDSPLSFSSRAIGKVTPY